MTFVERPLEAEVADCVEQGITSFKLYMAYPDTLQVDDDVIVDVLRATGRHGGLVTVHAENGAAITTRQQAALAAGHTGVVEHASTRPAEVEGEATARAAQLAEQVEAPIYIVHVSSAPALAAIRVAQERGVSIMAETCPQYLHLDVESPRRTPTVRTSCARHRFGMRGTARSCGTASGRVGCTPWPPTTAPGGCTTATPAPPVAPRAGPTSGRSRVGCPASRPAWPWCGRACATVGSRWPTGCGSAPKRRRGRSACGPGRDRCGSAPTPTWSSGIPNARQSLDAAGLHMRTDHSPYEGMVARGWPELVLSRGRVVARDGAFVGEPAWGRYLARDQVWFGQ